MSPSSDNDDGRQRRWLPRRSHLKIAGEVLGAVAALTVVARAVIAVAESLAK
ncbi:hypothetical protein [Actinoplanes sp. OR16]|uniref:hypothetical protein n=1 Tax=Actinoplanes sp. OR16 TaxID=946334 RepID=UPI00135F1C14|nr:hypothetical protein [Actinoplanes sp. OR16]